MSENIQQTYQNEQEQRKWYEKFLPRQMDVHEQEAREAIKRANDAKQNYQTYRRQDK